MFNVILATLLLFDHDQVLFFKIVYIFRQFVTIQLVGCGLAESIQNGQRSNSLPIAWQFPFNFIVNVD